MRYSKFEISPPIHRSVMLLRSNFLSCEYKSPVAADRSIPYAAPRTFGHLFKSEWNTFSRCWFDSNVIYKCKQERVRAAHL